MSRVISGAGRYLVVIAAAAALFLMSGCKQMDMATVWTGYPIIVDGDASEWSGLETTYLEEKKILIGLSNDGDNIYLLLRLGDPAMVQTMRMGSFILWVDGSRKKRQERGFRFFGGPEPARIREGRSPDDTMIIPTRLTVVTEGGERETSIPIDGTKGPVVSYRITSRIYTLEMSIPLSDNENGLYGIGAEPGGSLALGIELKVDREMMMQAGQRGISGRGRTGGGGGGGGMVGRGGGMGGMGGGMRGRGSGSLKEEKLWINTTLARPPQ